MGGGNLHILSHNFLILRCKGTKNNWNMQIFESEFYFFMGKPENPEGRRRSAYLPTVQQRAAAINANNGGKNATERDNY